MKPNTIDLNNVKPGCESIRDEILRLQDKIDEIKPIYRRYNKRLRLNKEEAEDKAKKGRKLYDLNIKLIGRIQALAHCEEGRNMEEIIDG